jgi:CubicO group peptidase (beta-lactamase class C family)
MLKPSCGTFAALIFLQSAHAFAAQEPAAPSLAARIDASIASFYKDDAPGATIIVVKDGQTVFRKAYGMADVARHEPLTPDTALRIGSITKQFTSTAILMLAEEGKLSLDDELTKFLPDYPTQGRKITIEHLLTHTSGIASFTNKPDYVANMTRDVTVGQMIDTFKNDPLEFDAGSRWRYNNSGYFLLGAIIEKVSGQTYASFLQQRIFTPLGMTHTAYEGHDRSPVKHALGYSAGADGYRPAAQLSMTQPFAAGALVSTVDDLARWDAAVSSGKLLKAASWQRAFTPYRLTTGKSTDYGYGWQIGTLRGAQQIAHSGGINGFRSYALRLPAEHVYVAVLSNTDSGVPSPDGPAMKAAAIAIGKPFPEYKAVAIDPALLDTYAGVYRSDEKANWTFTHAKDGLSMQLPGGPSIPLQAFSDSGFFTPGSVNWVEFKRGAKGEVTEVALHIGDTESVKSRIGPVVQRKAVRMTAEAFDVRKGRYQFPQGLVIELTRDGDRFFAQGTGQPKLEIYALSENTFFSNDVDAELRFEGSDPANEVVLSQGGQLLKGKKIQ